MIISREREVVSEQMKTYFKVQDIALLAIFDSLTEIHYFRNYDSLKFLCFQ